MKALTGDRELRTELSSHAELNREGVDELGLFRALPLALGLGALGWIALGALAFGIYKLSH